VHVQPQCEWLLGDTKTDLTPTSNRRSSSPPLLCPFTNRQFLNKPPYSDNMSRFPRLQTNALPDISESELANTMSPSRGLEMRNNLLAKLRPPPLVHSWEFWHDRQDRKKSANDDLASSSNTALETSSHAPPPQAAPKEGAADNYEDRLVKLHAIADVKSFWQMFNNFDVDALPLRDSIHLFHLGVKPVWEDPRNERGGAWTFRVPKDKARQFWQEICLMAIGESLQSAVESNRISELSPLCSITITNARSARLQRRHLRRVVKRAFYLLPRYCLEQRCEPQRRC
jgi:hypothetical protein